MQAAKSQLLADQIVVPPGFEPRLTEPKPGVLPLHHGTILYVLREKRYKSITIFGICQIYFRLFFAVAERIA